MRRVKQESVEFLAHQERQGKPEQRVRRDLKDAGEKRDFKGLKEL